LLNNWLERTKKAFIAAPKDFFKWIQDHRTTIPLRIFLFKLYVFSKA